MTPADAPGALLNAVLLSKRWRSVGERCERDLRAPVADNYVCTCVRTHVQTGTCTHVCARTGVRVHAHVCASVYVNTQARVYRHTCIHTCMCIRVCGACVYMHTCVNTHMHVSAPLRACL